MTHRRPNARFPRAAFCAALAACAATLAFATPAAADFRLCNTTGSRVGVALGYKDGDSWVTEGWWNIGANRCETLLRGQLAARYYYIYGEDYDNKNEVWDGPALMCVRDQEFTIRGIDNCLARGYERKGFFEIDTGNNRAWTVQLSADPVTQGQSAPPAVQSGRSAAAQDAR